MTEMLRAFRSFDQLLYNAVDPQLKPITVLEDVEAASMTSWIKNKLEKLDDGALKEFSLKQQIGSYAVKGKYRILQYLDEKEAKQERQRLAQLQNDLYKLAQENATGTFPLPGRIPLRQLAGPMDQFQGAKALLGKNDKVTVKSDESGDHSIDLSVTKRPSNSLAQSDDTRPSTGDMEMTILVRKPDLLGKSLWEFRHGKTSIFAHILDEEWMERFANGRETILPGSAMVCTVHYEYEYDEAGALLSASHDVVKVHRIEPPTAGRQTSMLDN